MTDRTDSKSAPRGELIGAIEIQSGREPNNPSLHFKLQKALSRRSTLRKAAADTDRIEKLKAPEGLSDEDFALFPPPPTEAQ